MQFAPAKLLLKSGEVFKGLSPSWQTQPYFGEAVFTTGMTGYVESLTDPSFAGQILVFTYPLIGNYGAPLPLAWESEKIQAAGVVVNDICLEPNHWNGTSTLLQWLEKERIPLLFGADTRAIAKTLRKQGAALGAICPEALSPQTFFDPNEEHLVKKVSISKKQVYGSGEKTILAVDCGMKENIIRHLLNYPVRVVRVPFDYDYSEEEYDGLFLSNGPGDPTVCQETISILRKALARKKPIFGICLGAQILSLAIGADTFKLKFGHRGQNHPCRDHERGVCILTSQNHGYAIVDQTLPQGWNVLFSSLNDGSVEGIIHESLPYFAVQFHPESNPGPTDAAYLFDRFYEEVKRA